MMTESRQAAMDRQTVRAALSRLALLGVAATMGLGAVGCDTIAEISFNERRFDKVRASGVTNVTACGEDDDRVELRFVLLDQENKVIRPGDRLLRDTAEAPDLTSDSVTLSRGRIYPTKVKNLLTCARACSGDVDCDPVLGESCFDGFCKRTEETDAAESCFPAGLTECRPFDPTIDDLGDAYTDSAKVSFCRASCSADEDCPGGGSCIDGEYCSLSSAGEFEQCSTNNQCASGFECLPLDTGVSSVGGVDPANTRYCSRETPLAIAPGSLDFLSPEAAGSSETPRAIAIVMDNSGSLSGRGVVQDDSTVKIQRATDPNNIRLSSAKAFLLTLSNQSFKENAVVSIWSYSGESELGVRPLTGSIGDTPPNPYVTDFSVARRTLDDLGLDQRFGRSNVFLALKSVADNMVALCDSNPRCTSLSDLRDTSIVLFTDGPDDSVIVTPGTDEAEYELRRRDWEANLQAAIDALSAAGPRVYIIHLDAAVNAEGLQLIEPDPQNARPYFRDNQGRFGPIEEYSQIACATGGQYIYVADPFALNFYFDLMSGLNGGTWKVDAGVEALGSVRDNNAYRMSAEVQVNFDGRNESFFLDPFGNQTSLGRIETDDTRPVIFRREGLDVNPIGEGGTIPTPGGGGGAGE